MSCSTTFTMVEGMTGGRLACLAPQQDNVLEVSRIGSAVSIVVP